MKFIELTGELYKRHSSEVYDFGNNQWNDALQVFREKLTLKMKARTIIILNHSLEAVCEGRFKIESCQVSIFNSVDEVVKLEHKD